MKSTQPAIAIDWQKIHSRLASCVAANETAQQLSPERSRLVMDARAAALAHVPPMPLSAAGTFEVLRFQLGTERYAIHAQLVREVLRQPEVTLVPGTPEFVAGITNLRGEMLAVVDLGEFLSLDLPARESPPWLIVLGNNHAEFGIIADEVAEVVTLRADTLHLPTDSLAPDTREFISGVTSDALIVLDGEVLLTDPRLFID